ncbi:MAG: hypothetical protein DCC75_03445 [Proteobacteria bacterium]|nr:MAG: hypothetical protein DCC75_03445 [Pseudomonadota bacterium]
MQGPTPVSPNAVKAQIAEASRITLSENLKAVLSVGRILEVVVSQNGSQFGILVDGRFVAAAFSKQPKPGERLKVLVADTSDALVLKVLENLSQLGEQVDAAPDGAMGTSLVQLLRSVLPRETLSNLKSLFQIPSQSPLPKKAAAGPQGDAASPSPATSSQNTQDTSPLAKTIEQLIRKNIMIGPDVLEKPEQAFKILSNLSQNSVLQNLKEARQSLKQLAELGTQRYDRNLLEALRSHIGGLLEESISLGFNQEGVELLDQAPQLVAKHLKFSVAVSQYANSSSSAVSSRQPALEPVLANSKESPLALLLHNLLRITASAQEHSAEGGDALIEVVHDLNTQLASLRSQKAGDQSVRKALEESLTRLKQLPERYSSGFLFGREDPQAASMKSLEVVLNGQEILNRLNPLLQTLGEPALLILPALCGQSLFNWNLFFEAPEVNPDEEKKTGSAAEEQYEKLCLNLELPNLGQLQVHAARRSGEVHVNICAGDQTACDYLKSRLPELEKRLSEGGYERIDLHARKQEFRPQVPEWLSSITKTSVLA